MKFRSLRANALYTVNIYDSSYSGTPVQLTGASKPFETQEDDDDDWFLPVRTQSGYLRIVDTGKDNDGNDFDWRDLIPMTNTERPVTLTNGGRLLWQGYIQPQTFSGQMYEPVQEREFPLMCPLSVLNGVDVDTSIREVKNFAFLLYKIVEATGHEFRFLYFSGDGEQVQDWLTHKIDWYNFIDLDEDGNWVAKYDYYTLLEEVCKFFGWMCRTEGSQMWFLSPDEQFSEDYSEMTAQDLYMLGQQDISIETQSYRYVYMDIDDNVYASTINNIQLLQGIHKVKVTADINKQDVGISIPYDKIEDMYKTNHILHYTYGENGHHFLMYPNGGRVDHSYTFDDMKITMQGEPYMGNAFFRVQEFYEGSLDYKHNYNWSTCLVLDGVVSHPGGMFRIQSRVPHNYDHGVFCISADTRQVYIEEGSYYKNPGTGKLICSLAIGDKWWNGSSWQNDQTSFDIPIGIEGEPQGQSSGQIINNRELDGIYNAYDGYGIPIGDVMGGVIDFQIHRVELKQEHDHGSMIELTDLKMQFVREKAYSEYNDRSENVYVKENTSPFTDDYDVDLIFASWNGNACGQGIVMNSNGTYCNGIEYGAQIQEPPEQHLADRIARYGSVSRVVCTMELRTDALDIRPSHFLRTAYFTGYPVAISYDWRDDVTRCKIFQI